MATRSTVVKKKAPAAPGVKRKPPDPRKQRARMIKALLTKAAKDLKDDESKKTSMGDFIKLVQLQDEATEENQPTDIKVGWVDRLESGEGE